jgi:hypothetical protein
MNRTLKLIWNFHGPDAEHTARHHAVHLKEFAKKEQLSQDESGIEQRAALHWVAYLLVEEAQMIIVRDALRPDGGEVVA